MLTRVYNCLDVIMMIIIRVTGNGKSTLLKCLSQSGLAIGAFSEVGGQYYEK